MPLLIIQSNQFEVLINGSLMSEAVQKYLVRITVERDLQLPSLFQIEFSHLSTLPTDEFNLDNLSVLEPGREIEIILGAPRLLPVVKGEILGWEPQFSSDRPHHLTVWGCDYLHRLQRGSKTRSFVKQKDSDIASQIASEVGLSAKAITSNYEHKYLMQAHQSDLQFLQERAQQIGYEIFMENKTLVFQPLLHDSANNISLDMGLDLQEFQPRLSLAGQVTTTTVRTWDVKDKITVVTTNHSTGTTPKLGSDSGASLTNKVFGDIETVIVPPAKNDDGKNDLRLIQSRSGHTIQLNDKAGEETIEIIDKSGSNKITFDTASNTITIASDKDIKLSAPNGMITLDAQEIEVKAETKIQIEAGTEANIKATGKLNLKGGMINLN